MIFMRLKMTKISWLDSVNMQSGIHITTHEDSMTLCGYNFTIAFDDGVWKPFRVGNHATHKCQTCFNKAKAMGIDVKHWDERVPERDATIPLKKYLRHMKSIY